MNGIHPPAQTAALDGYPRKWLVLAAVAIGMFMALLDATVVNIAVPAILSDLDTSITGVSWVLNAYNLAMATLFLSMGRLADRFGQKRIFIGGLVVFTLFSLACALAPGIGWLIAFRVGQGVGGAAMAPVSLSILLGAFPPRQHGMAVGLWGALGTVAAALGPVLGGLLVEYTHWSWIFYINVPIGAVALGMAFAFVPERRRAAHGAGVDRPAILLSAAGLFCLTLALIEGNDWGWLSGRMIALYVVAASALPVFLLWERHAAAPMFDVRLLRIRSFTAANTAMLLVGTAMGGALFLLVIYLVSVLGYSELRAAIAITPMPATALVLAPNVGRLVDRIGPRFPAAVGAVSFGVGMILLAQLGATSILWDTIWRVIVLGLGLGFAMPTLSAAAMGSLPQEAGGVGSGALATFRQTGFVLGTAVLVAVFSHTAATAVATATREATAYVNAQPMIPDQARTRIVAGLRRNAARATSAGGNPAARLRDPLTGASRPSDPATAATQRLLGARIGRIYRTQIAGAFSWPFYAAAAFALLAVIPALLTGRRLGEHAGHHELTREQRSAAGDRDPSGPSAQLADKGRAP